MRTVYLERTLGTLATVAVLTGLATTVGLGWPGWIVGVLVGEGAVTLVAVGRLRSDKPIIFPADWVTLARAVLSAGVAALVADSFFGRPLPVTAVVALSTIALVLDAVDGRVARRTRTATPVGARFDGEVDAFLILLLSIAVAGDYGAWVLTIGAARYALLLASWPVPWLRAPLPARYWRKVVAAVQGIVLTAAVSGLLDRRVGTIAVAVALLLLTESFGRDVLWLYRTGAGARSRLLVHRATTLLAATIVWAVLVTPDQLQQLGPGAFAHIPVEAVILIAATLVMPTRPGRILAAIAGALFGLIAVVKVLNAAFYEELGRPFDPVLDWGNVGSGIGVVRDSIGQAATDVVLLLAAVALIVLVGVVTASTLRLGAAVARHRPRSARGTAVFLTLATLGLSLSVVPLHHGSAGSTSATAIVLDQVRDARAAINDQRHFGAALDATDPQSEVPGSDLFTGLRGKDVLIVFVESYGQVAVQGTTFSPGVNAVLHSRTDALTRAGWTTQSAWLTSPTFGGISWLAHSTLQSGLWVDSQQRYNQLVASSRFTLAEAFHRAGWRTVSDIPSDDWDWSAGTSFYHYDQLYDQRNVGYRGPMFSYAPMPDQYTLAAFQRYELQPGHKPVMAEIDLVSSHNPWTPLPRMVPWEQVGDGSIFDPMPAEGLSPAEAWRDLDTVRELYGQSIQYSLQALTSWVTQVDDPNLVVVMLGDHQPVTTVTGADASHDVPISIIARDPSVFAQIRSWKWQPGLLPGPTAPRWRMDAFRDEFLSAYNAP